MRRFVIVGLLMLLGTGGAAISLHADTMVVSGTISQSTQDGTGPAVSNTSLNNIMDGDAYTVTLNFTGSITTPGTFTSFTSADFSDPANSADESSFTSVSLTILPPSGGMDEFSLLGCLSTGSGCLFGNELDLNFMIPAGSLNLGSVAAQSVFPLTPLDLLEDDGTTDIQGSVTGYSYSPPSNAVPEPGLLILLGSGLAALTVFRRKLA